MYDLGIKNGTVYLNGGFFNCNIYIKNGVITNITNEDLGCKVEENASGKLVLPGFIDPHVHFSLGVGSNISSDDFYTGSIKGVLGGVTTYIDFLDPIKSVEEIEEAYKNRMKLAEKSVSDYAFHTTIANPKSSPEEIIKAGIEKGITSIKLFTTYADTDRRTYDKYIYDLLKLSKKYNVRVVIHAENDELVSDDKKVKVKEHEVSRPVVSEVTEVLKLAEMARETGGLLYIVHVSCGTTVKRLKECFSKELKSKQIILESCPHYYLFNSEIYKGEEGYLYLMTPPLRPEEERKLLYEQIDFITTIGTDHCPFAKELKNKKYTSEIAMGIGGIQYSFQNMYTEFGRKIISKFTDGPAKAYGLYPQKGSLMVGSYADIVIYDENIKEVINDSESIYDGKSMKGKIEKVFLRGKLIAEKGKVLESKGSYVNRNEISLFDNNSRL